MADPTGPLLASRAVDTARAQNDHLATALRIIAGKPLTGELRSSVTAASGGDRRLLVDDPRGAAVDDHAADVHDPLDTRSESGREEVTRAHDHRPGIAGDTVDDTIDVGERRFERGRISGFVGPDLDARRRR